MIKEIYAVYDKVKGRFTSGLWEAENDMDAQRIFVKMVNAAPENYRDDFELKFIGYFDEKDGRFEVFQKE